MIEGLLQAVSRRAWPRPLLDHLLRAALLRDQQAAAFAWRNYEAAADFDRLTAIETRLLGLVAKRLQTLAPDSSMRARIGGIERANWSRSQLSVRESDGGLRALAAAGVSALAVGATARFAQGGPHARGRLLTRIDIVLQPEDMERAFDLLTVDGWRPAGPGSMLYQRARQQALANLAFVRGRFGSILMHRTPFAPPYASAAEDAPLWQRSLGGWLGQAAIRLPSATDAVAMALAGNICGEEKDADRLAETAVLLESGVDWDLFQHIADRRRMHACAAEALRYVHERLGRPIPSSVIGWLEKRAIRRPLALVTVSFRPRRITSAVRVFGHLLAAAGEGRYFGSRRRVVFPSPFRNGAELDLGAASLERDLPLPERKSATAWSGVIDLAISVDLPPASRRLDFEINSTCRHHVKLTALVRNKGRRRRPLRFRFPIRLAPEESKLVLVAAASRGIGSDARQDEIERYGAMPFRLVRLRVIETTSK